jgi:hypothetical protein
LADETIRIIVEAVDLASENLRRIALNILQNTEGMRQTTKAYADETDRASQNTERFTSLLARLGAQQQQLTRSTGQAGQGLEQFARSKDQAADSGNRLGTSLALVARGMQAVEAGLVRLDPSFARHHQQLQIAERSTSSWGSSLQTTGHVLRDFGRVVEDTTHLLGDHDRELKSKKEDTDRWNTSLMNMGRTVVQFHNLLDRFTGSLREHDRHLQSVNQQYDQFNRRLQLTSGTSRELVRSMHGMEVAVRRGAGAFGEFEQAASSANESKKKLDRNVGTDHPEAQRKMERSISSTIGALGSFIGTLAAAGGGLYLAGNAVGSVTVGIIGLSSALSALVGIADVVPAAFTALAGSLAAVTTIFKPAIDQVQQYLTAIDKATNDPTAATAAGPGNVANAQMQARQNVGDAERNLQRARADSVMQIQDLERRLFELRIHNTQQIADAERAVRQAEIDGLQRIIAAEERLHQLRMADRAQETQLEAALANAQASARGEAARGGANQAIADAAVQQAQDTLTQFQRQARGDEAVARGDVTTARQDRQRNVADAQRTLQRTIQDNTRQVQDLERQLAEQRIQNTRQIADAERALTRARIDGARQVAAAERSSNTQLSNARAILASMTPLQRELALGIQHMKEDWLVLTAPARDRFLHLAIDLVDRMQRHLPQLASLVSHYADVLTQLGHGLLNRVFQPQAFQRDTRFANQQATNLGTVGQGALAGAQAIETIATSQGSEQFLRWLAEATKRFGRLLEEMARIQNRKDGFVGFFTAVRTTVKQVADIFWNLAQAFANVFEIGFAPGSGFLGGIVNLTDRFKDWTNSQEGRNSLRHFIQTGFKDLHQWALVLGPVIGLIGQIIVVTTEWTGPLRLAVRFLSWILDNPIGQAVLGPIFAFGAAWAAAGAILPGNQRTLSRIFDVMGKLASIIFTRLIPAFVIFISENVLAGTTAGEVTAAMAEETTVMGALEAAAITLDVSMGVLIATVAGIVLAVVAVVAIFVVLYLKWAPFHQIVDRIGNAIKNVLIVAMHLLVRAMEFVKDHWQAMLLILTGPIGAAFLIIYNHFGTLKRFLIDVFNDLKRIIPAIWSSIWNIIKKFPVVQMFVDIGNQIKKHWDSIWHGIYNVARFVWDKFADGVNFVLRIVGADQGQMLPHMPAIGGQRQQQTSTPVGGPGRFHGNIQPAAMGGRFENVPGGMIHIVEAGAPEYVISTDPKYRRRSLGLIIEALNELGVPIPKFQHGGRASAAPPNAALHLASGIDPSGLTPALKFLGAWVSEHGGLITSTTGGTHAPNSYHYRGEAIDIAAPGYNSPWIWSNLHARDRAFVELFGPTFMPGGGGLFHYGVPFRDSALQAEHQNHIHSAFTGTLADITKVLQGSGTGGILGSILGAINPINALHWVEDHIPGFGGIDNKFGRIGGFMHDMGAFARDKVIGWIKNTPGMLARVAESLGGSVLDAVTSVFSDAQIAHQLSRGQAFALRGISGDNPSANQLRARILAQGLYGWGADQFPYLLRLWEQESGWSAHAVNPRSNAQGIPQLLPSQHPGPHPGFPSWPPIDPVKQILWGLAYIHGRRDERDPRGAWAHEQRYNWYDFGGPVGGAVGTPFPAMVHGGEWIINRMQQMKLAQLFGSWDRAKQYLFTSQAPAYGSLFPHRASTAPAAAGRGVNQTFILHEVQPQTDMDYVMRMAEIHMRSLA